MSIGLIIKQGILSIRNKFEAFHKIMAYMTRKEPRKFTDIVNYYRDK
jgi:hypothetical protein